MNELDFENAVWLLCDDQDSIVCQIELLAEKFLRLSESPTLSDDLRYASTVINRRLNVAAFEVSHCLDVVPHDDEDAAEPIEQALSDEDEALTLF